MCEAYHGSARRGNPFPKPAVAWMSPTRDEALDHLGEQCPAVVIEPDGLLLLPNRLP
jgi:hypothetical protein